MKRVINDSICINEILENETKIDDVINKLTEFKNFKEGDIYNGYVWKSIDGFGIKHYYEDFEILLHGQRYETNLEKQYREKAEERNRKSKENNKIKNNLEMISKKYGLTKEQMQDLIKDLQKEKENEIP